MWFWTVKLLTEGGLRPCWRIENHQYCQAAIVKQLNRKSSWLQTNNIFIKRTISYMFYYTLSIVNYASEIWFCPIFVKHALNVARDRSHHGYNADDWLRHRSRSFTAHLSIIQISSKLYFLYVISLTGRTISFLWLLRFKCCAQFSFYNRVNIIFIVQVLLMDIIKVYKLNFIPL